MQAREGAAVEDGLHRAGEAPQLTLEWSSPRAGAKGLRVGEFCGTVTDSVARRMNSYTDLITWWLHPRACCQAPGLSLPSGLPWLCCSAGLCSRPLGSRQCLAVACVQAVAVSGSEQCLWSGRCPGSEQCPGSRQYPSSRQCPGSGLCPGSSQCPSRQQAVFRQQAVSSQWAVSRGWPVPGQQCPGSRQYPGSRQCPGSK